MDWQGVRRAARVVTHEVFGLSAEYHPVSGAPALPVVVRVHNQATRGSVAFARRNGYGEVAEESVRIITDNPLVSRGGVFHVLNLLRDDGTTGPVSYRVDHVLPTEGDGFWTCLVAEVRT